MGAHLASLRCVRLPISSSTVAYHYEQTYLHKGQWTKILLVSTKTGLTGNDYDRRMGCSILFAFIVAPNGSEAPMDAKTTRYNSEGWAWFWT